MPQPRLIHSLSVEENVTMDASTKGFCGHMNNLVFRGKWSGSNGRETHINLLKLEVIWKACQRFEKEIKGKGVSFRIDDTTIVAYLMKDGGAYCRELNGCKEDLTEMSHSNGMSGKPLRCSKPQDICPIQRQGSQGVESRSPHLLQTI